MHANSFISDKLSRLYDVVVMILKSKELNLLRCLAKNQGWTIRLIKRTHTYAIHVLDGHGIAFLCSGYEVDIKDCAQFIINCIRCYAGSHVNFNANLASVPEFKTQEELELNLVLAGSFSSKPDYEIRPKSFKRSKRIFIVK